MILRLLHAALRSPVLPPVNTDESPSGQTTRRPVSLASRTRDCSLIRSAAIGPMTEAMSSMARPASEPNGYPSRSRTRFNANRNPRSDAKSSKDRPRRVLPPATVPLPGVHRIPHHTSAIPKIARVGVNHGCCHPRDTSQGPAMLPPQAPSRALVHRSTACHRDTLRRPRSTR